MEPPSSAGDDAGRVSHGLAYTFDTAAPVVIWTAIDGEGCGGGVGPPGRNPYAAV